MGGLPMPYLYHYRVRAVSQEAITRVCQVFAHALRLFEQPSVQRERAVRVTAWVLARLSGRRSRHGGLLSPRVSTPRYPARPVPGASLPCAGAWTGEFCREMIVSEMARQLPSHTDSIGK